jgi:hypothetical protein
MSHSVSEFNSFVDTWLKLGTGTGSCNTDRVASQLVIAQSKEIPINLPDFRQSTWNHSFTVQSDGVSAVKQSLITGNN